MAWIYHRRGGYTRRARSQPPAGIVPCQRADNIRPYKLPFTEKTSICLKQMLVDKRLALAELSGRSENMPVACFPARRTACCAAVLRSLSGISAARRLSLRELRSAAGGLEAVLFKVAGLRPLDLLAFLRGSGFLTPKLTHILRRFNHRQPYY